MHEQRKDDHLRICLEEDVSFKDVTTGLEKYRFVHQALPEIALDDVSLRTEFLGKALRAPLLISSMTGGTSTAAQINERLARAAQLFGVAIGVGSQRAAIENDDLAYSYRVRDVAPDILLLANLGAVQLNYGYGVTECQRAVDMIRADALILHLNPLHEAMQPRGDTDFRELLPKIEQICTRLSVPVVAKEVGWGISESTARRLAEVGVAAIDVAGAGGTSWGEVERHRHHVGDSDGTSPQVIRLITEMAEWGIPTAQSLVTARRGAPELPLIASGGLRTGLDVAKSIALGASLGGIATPLLYRAAISAEEVRDYLEHIAAGLRLVMFGIGARDVVELRDSPYLVNKIGLTQNRTITNRRERPRPGINDGRGEYRERFFCARHTQS